MIFEYEGYWGCKSKCDIEIHGNIVIATELDDNPGTSITNFAVQLATLVCNKFNISYKNLIWIEHYPERKRTEESFDFTTFNISEKGFSSPRWKRVTKENILSVI